MPDAQKRMQKLLDSVVAQGHERGIQLTAYLNGRLIVDAWAGVADAATGRPVDGHTLFPVFSVTKGMMATLVHRLVERGQLTYDTPIASVWPEFAAKGKQGITVRHVLSHMAGLPYMPCHIGYEQLVDWQAMCAAIAGLSPASGPGEQMFYHALTFSWLVGEVVRRVAGRPVSQFLQEEICRPLGIGRDMFIGIPDEVEDRVAALEEIFEPGTEPSTQDNGMPRDVPGWLTPLSLVMNRRGARRACLPGFGGIMTARAIARHYAALLPGGVDGVELLPPDRVRQATQLQIPTRQPPDQPAMRRSLGYYLGGAAWQMGHRLTAFGHVGYGGSIGYADLEYGLAVGLTKNLFSKNDTQGLILRELRDALGIPQ